MDAPFGPPVPARVQDRVELLPVRLCTLPGARTGEPDNTRAIEEHAPLVPVEKVQKIESHRGALDSALVVDVSAIAAPSDLAEV